jgi:hypothetical protein
MADTLPEGFVADAPAGFTPDSVPAGFQPDERPKLKLTREEVEASIPPSDMPGPIGRALYNAAGALYTPFQILSRTGPVTAVSDAIDATHQLINRMTGYQGPERLPMNQPVIPPEQMGKAIEFFNPNAGPTPVGSGQEALKEFGSEQISGLTTPKSMLAILSGRASPALPATEFAGPMVQDVPEAVKQAATAPAGVEKDKALLRLAMDIAGPIAMANGLKPKAIAETIADTFAAPEAGSALKDSLLTRAGRDMPKTTALSQPAGEAGVRLAASVEAAPHLARYFSERVLDGLKEVDADKLGAAITEEQLRGRRDTLINEAHKAMAAGDEAAAHSFLDEASKVKTVIGSAFKTEGELADFVTRPDVLEAARRIREQYKNEIDPLAAQTGLDPAAKPATGGLFGEPLFFNLFGLQEGAIPEWFKPTGKNSLQILGSTPGMTRGTRFAKTRTGTAQGYGTNFHDMVQNAYRGFLEAARKNEFDQKLQAAGLASTFERPGWTKAMGSFGKELWLDPRVASEYGIANRAYKSGWEHLGLVKLQSVANKYQMWGMTDAIIHVKGMAKALWESPDSQLKTDTGIGVLLRSDLALKAYRAFQSATDTHLERLRKMAELANIGALDAHPTMAWHHWITNPLSPAVSKTIQGIKLILGDTYDRMAAQGVTKWSETGKREFVNQGLQYNKRLQGHFIRNLRDFQVGPFATAAKARMVRGAKAMALSPWLEGADTASKAWLRANMVSKMVGNGLLIGAVNYAISKTMFPRGTKLGDIDTSQKDKHGNPLHVKALDTLSALGPGLRQSGIGAAIEAKRSGLSNVQAFEAARRDVINTQLGWLGPAPRFAYGATIGQHLGVGLPAYPAAPPGQSQGILNLKTASQELNPLYATSLQSALGGEPQKDFGEQLRGLLGVVPGMKPQLQERLPRIVTAGEFNRYMDSFAAQVRKAGPGERSKVIREGLAKLSGQNKAKALAELQRRHLAPR